MIVSQTGPVVAPQTVSDGTDTLSNIEQLQFAGGTASSSVPAVPTITSAKAGVGSATATYTMPTGTGLAPTSFTIRAVPTAGAGTPITSTVPGTALVGTVTGLTNGTTYTLQVAATNAAGTSAVLDPIGARHADLQADDDAWRSDGEDRRRRRCLGDGDLGGAGQ